MKMPPYGTWRYALLTVIALPVFLLFGICEWWQHVVESVSEARQR